MRVDSASCPAVSATPAPTTAARKSLRRLTSGFCTCTGDAGGGSSADLEEFGRASKISSPSFGALVAEYADVETPLSALRTALPFFTALPPFRSIRTLFSSVGPVAAALHATAPPRPAPVDEAPTPRSRVASPRTRWTPTANAHRCAWVAPAPKTVVMTLVAGSNVFVRSPTPGWVPRARVAILRPTWSCQVRPPSNLQSCLAPVFDLYGEQSESGKYKCEISFSNRKFGAFHHLSPYRKSFGNFVHIGCKVVDRVRPIGVSPWFSATTRRLFGRVCRRKPLHRIGNSPLASAPAARRSTARDTTAPHRTTEPRSAPHAEPPGRDPTAPVPSRRSSAEEKRCSRRGNKRPSSRAPP